MLSSASARRANLLFLKLRRISRVYLSVGGVRTAVYVVRWEACMLTGNEVKPGGGGKDFHLVFYA